MAGKFSIIQVPFFMCEEYSSISSTSATTIASARAPLSLLPKVAQQSQKQTFSTRIVNLFARVARS